MTPLEGVYCHYSIVEMKNGSTQRFRSFLLILKPRSGWARVNPGGRALNPMKLLSRELLIK